MLLRQKIGNWNVAGLCRWCVSVSVQWHSVDGNVTILYIWAFVGVITAVLGLSPASCNCWSGFPLVPCLF